MARSTRLVVLIKNIYTLCGRKRFLLPVTYFATNLVYPFTLRVTGIINKTKNDRFSWCHQLSNTRYSDKGSAMEMEIYKATVPKIVHCICLWVFVGVRVDVAPCWNKFALRKKLKNLLAKSQHFSFYSFQELSDHTDGRQTDRARSTRLVILIKNMYTLLGRKRFLIPVTYFPTKLIITRKNTIVEYLDCQIPVTQLMGPKGNGDMQAAKRDWNAPPTRDLNIWLGGW